jgi:hypothetical protein
MLRQRDLTKSGAFSIIGKFKLFANNCLIYVFIPRLFRKKNGVIIVVAMFAYFNNLRIESNSLKLRHFLHSFSVSFSVLPQSPTGGYVAFCGTDSC